MKQFSLEDRLPELEALLTGFWLTDLSNFSAFLFQEMPDLNWVGFYLNDGTKLRLGPFQGKPACTEIPFTKGVCGASFTQGQSLIVSDVHEFPGHIACDAASRSELVIPLFLEESCVGVLDIDSPRISRFSEADREGMEKAVAILMRKLSLKTFGALAPVR